MLVMIGAKTLLVYAGTLRKSESAQEGKSWFREGG